MYHSLLDFFCFCWPQSQSYKSKLNTLWRPFRARETVVIDFYHVQMSNNSRMSQNSGPVYPRDAFFLHFFLFTFFLLLISMHIINIHEYCIRVHDLYLEHITLVMCHISRFTYWYYLIVKWNNKKMFRKKHWLPGDKKLGEKRSTDRAMEKVEKMNWGKWLHKAWEYEGTTVVF